MSQLSPSTNRLDQSSGSSREREGGRRTLCFGEVLLRLTPQTVPGTGGKGEEGFFPCGQPTAAPAAVFDAWWGGSEANVAVGLALLQKPATLLTSLPGSSLGQSATTALHERDVQVLAPKTAAPDPKAHTNQGRLGLYFTITQAAGKTLHYDRIGSTFSLHPPGPKDVDWSSYERFHTSGINPALSPVCHQATFDLLRAARAHKLTTSFDLNLRKELWSDQAAGSQLRDMLPSIDLLFAHAGQLASAFDLPPLDLQEPDKVAHILRKFCQETGLETLIVTNRKSRAEERPGVPPLDSPHDREIQLMALQVKGNATHFRKTPWCAANDRSGSGDSFAAGVLAGLSNNWPTDQCLEQGLAAASLTNQSPGDLPTFSHQEVQHRQRLLFENDVLQSDRGGAVS